MALCKMYKLVVDGYDMIYIGHTTSTLTKRRLSHKYTKNCSSRGLFDLGEVRIVLIEEYPCDTELKARQREQAIIDEIGDKCINRNRAYNSIEYITERRKETNDAYYKENKDKIRERQMVYYNDNKDKIREYSKVYAEQNKDKRALYKEQNKDHIKEYKKEYHKAHYDDASKTKRNEYYKENQDKIQAYHKAYREQNKDKRALYEEQNKDRLKAYKKAYNKAYREAMNSKMQKNE